MPVKQTTSEGFHHPCTLLPPLAPVLIRWLAPSARVHILNSLLKMPFCIQPPCTICSESLSDRRCPWEACALAVSRHLWCIPSPPAHPHHCHPRVSCPRLAHTQPRSLVSQNSKFLKPAFYKPRWLCSCYSSALPVYLLFSTWESPSYSPRGGINATFSVEPSPPSPGEAVFITSLLTLRAFRVCLW